MNAPARPRLRRAVLAQLPRAVRTGLPRAARAARRVHPAPAAAAAALAILAAAQPLDADLWVHLNNGRFIAAAGRLPYPDPFSFSAGSAVWTVHEWLPALVLYAVVGLGGVGLAAVVFALIYAAVWLLLERALAAHGVGPWARAAAIGAAALPLLPFAGPRPLAFGVLAAAAAAALTLEHRRSGSRLIWLTPLVFLYWGNVHASFPIGLAVLGTALGEAVWARAPVPFAGERPRTRLGWTALVAALSAAAVAVNPSGPRLLGQPFFQWGGEFRRFNSDWLPPAAGSDTWWSFAVFIGLAALTALLGWRRLRPAELALLVVLIAAGVSARKVMPFAAVVAPLLLAGPLRGGGAPHLRPPAWLSRAAAGLALAAAVGAAAVMAPRSLAGPTAVPMPHAARSVLTAAAPARVFNTYHWGAYLTWRLWPRTLVFIDGRFDLFVPGPLADYLTVTGLDPAWRETLARIDPDAVLIETASPLAQRLAEPDSGWRDAGGDAVARVFLPAPPSPAPSKSKGGA